VLLPEYLDDYVSENDLVRVIDVFVDELDLGRLGFEGVTPEATGRPGYHPGMMLAPDFKTIADFRKDNGPAIRAACRQFIALCRRLELVARCADLSIVLSEELKATIQDGFGTRKSGEDPFDAVIGLLGMIEVVEGRRPAAPAAIPNVQWEGWIFGKGI
jgi:hypothetical protein